MAEQQSIRSGAQLYFVLGSLYYNFFCFSGGATAARRVGECLTCMHTHTLMHTSTDIEAASGLAGEKEVVSGWRKVLRPAAAMRLRFCRIYKRSGEILTPTIHLFIPLFFLFCFRMSPQAWGHSQRKHVFCFLKSN